MGFKKVLFGWLFSDELSKLEEAKLRAEIDRIDRKENKNYGTLMEHIAKEHTPLPEAADPFESAMKSILLNKFMEHMGPAGDHPGGPSTSPSGGIKEGDMVSEFLKFAKKSPESVAEALDAFR